jgi:transcriptional regulator with XRE-family HTH domain
MNGNHSHEARHDNHDVIELGATAPVTATHRLGEARRAKRITHFELARRLGVSAETVRLQEEAADVSIGTLNQWAAVLNVPVTELVVEPEEWLQAARLAKAQAARLLEIAAKLRDRSRRRSIKRLAQTFVDQLSEIHPELGAQDNDGERRPRQTPGLRPRPSGPRRNGKNHEPPKS